MTYVNDLLNYYDFAYVLSSDIYDEFSLQGFPHFIHANVFAFGSMFSSFTLISTIPVGISNIEV